MNAFAGFRAARLLLAEAERELWDSPQVRRPVDADAIIDAVAGLLRPLTAVMLCLSTDRVTPNPTRRARPCLVDLGGCGRWPGGDPARRRRSR